jgi:hypothetical protein
VCTRGEKSPGPAQAHTGRVRVRCSGLEKANDGVAMARCGGQGEHGWVTGLSPGRVQQRQGSRATVPTQGVIGCSTGPAVGQEGKSRLGQ